MRSTLRKLLARLPSLMGGEEGQDLVEYGLLCTLLSLSFIASAPGVSSAVNKVFTNVSNSLSQSQPSTDGSQGGSSGGGQGSSTSGGQSGSGSGDTGSGDGGHHLDEVGLRGTEPAPHVIGEEFAERIGRKLRNGNHHHCP